MLFPSCATSAGGGVSGERFDAYEQLDDQPDPGLVRAGEMLESRFESESVTDSISAELSAAAANSGGLLRIVGSNTDPASEASRQERENAAVGSGTVDAQPSPRQVPTATARQAAGRMLIHSGELLVEVPRAEEAGKEFLAKVEGWGGYLQSQTGTAWTVRVPAARFDAAYEAAQEAGRVIAKRRRANDVSEEFVDLGIRLDNARKSRSRLLEILDKAEKVEDILKIETELRRLTGEIERMEGRMKFLRDQVAMSTLRAEFRSVQQAPVAGRQRHWSRFGWINRVGAAAVMEAF
jgi:hypothetical protein